MDMKYILYARKSSEDKARQILSLESQINTMQKRADDLGLHVVKVLSESKSAKKPDNRPVFAEMVKMLEQGKADGIICWKLDRLSRNPVDSGKIQWLSQQGIIKDIQTAERRYLPDDNALVFNVESGMANQYIRDLSKNVKRGNKTKLERGGWPGVAPIGYLNDKLNKTIIIDEERAPYIGKAFELYATGGYSVMDISSKLYEMGLRTLNGRRVYKSKIHRILSNPFYCGLMKRDGRLYQGRHESILPEQLFEKVQDALYRRIHTKKQKLDFPLRGYLKCASCGCAFTASRKKGHDYYYCTNGRNRCEEHKSYMRSESIEAIVATLLDEIWIDEELIEMAYLARKEKGSKDESYLEASRETLLKKLESLAGQESKLLDVYLAEHITQEAYEAKMKRIQNEREMINSQLRKIGSKTEGGLSTLEQIKEIFLTANKAKKEFLEATDNRKSILMKRLLWNLEIQSKEMASSSFKMPYELLKKSPKNGDFLQMLGLLDVFGTVDWKEVKSELKLFDANWLENRPLV
ncbi:MAG: recombinase family protein [Candidatus Pacebacteria bacterium]|nr:recombinase family protein [Candidatus Paceibacterota bacterium]